MMHLLQPVFVIHKLDGTSKASIDILALWLYNYLHGDAAVIFSSGSVPVPLMRSDVLQQTILWVPPGVMLFYVLSPLLQI